ncbi:hypothetical protein ACLKA7_000204 [Drosophila subpalustris]
MPNMRCSSARDSETNASGLRKIHNTSYQYQSKPRNMNYPISDTAILTNYTSSLRCPLEVEGGRIVATVEIGGKAMLATIDTGATHSFMSEDCVRLWAIQGEAQHVQARIRLADGSALEVVKSLKVDVGMTGKVVNMPLLIMPSLQDHVLLGMDFLCAMGTTVRCGNAELILETVEDPTAEPVGPYV